MRKIPVRFHLAFLGLLTVLSVQAQPVHYFYGGDKTPAENPYAAWFTTVGPGHPTGSYFVGTEWGSDGDVLTIQTRHPNDYPGATSLGIWFGRTDGYGDPSSGLNLAPTANGNRVEVRLALGQNSSEWSLYWYDGSSRGASWYFVHNGFHIYTSTSGIFVPSTTMTNFHTYASHIQDGKVSYYLDGVLLATGPTFTGPANFLLLGDGSAGDVSGYGTLRVDSLDIAVNAGPVSPPQPAPIHLTDGAMLTNGTFQFAFTNIPGLKFGVQSSTNLVSGNWTVLSNATEIAPGQFRFTDVAAPTIQQHFYRVLAQ